MMLCTIFAAALQAFLFQMRILQNAHPIFAKKIVAHFYGGHWKLVVYVDRSVRMLEGPLQTSSVFKEIKN